MDSDNTQITRVVSQQQQEAFEVLECQKKTMRGEEIDSVILFKAPQLESTVAPKRGGEDGGYIDCSCHLLFTPRKQQNNEPCNN